MIKREQFLQNMVQKQEYLDAIGALQKENISVLADIVLNQKMGGDTEENDRCH